MANPYVAVLLGDQNPTHAEQWNRFEKDFVLPQLRITPTSSVLDIGCGIGRWAESIIPAAGYYCGTDFSSEMVEAARKRNSYADCDYDFHCLSFQETVCKPAEFYKKGFNRLIVGGVCMYINDEELPGCYDGVLKLLDEHCIVYFTETVAVEKRLTLDECPSEALKTNYDVIYRTPKEYKEYYKVFTDAGFVIKEQKYLPHLNSEKQFIETDRWYTIMER
nr:class I SAM-dependent methyltransferase [Cohnella sp. GbtcB17]